MSARLMRRDMRRTEGMRTVSGRTGGSALVSVVQRHSIAPETALRTHCARRGAAPRTGAVGCRAVEDTAACTRLKPRDAMVRWKVLAVRGRAARICSLFMTHLVKRQQRRER
jgi:hypothetical protein